MPYDILITNGTVVDGTGMPAYRADVAIKDGCIVARGRLAGAAASRVINAEGLVVAPGIIDVHTHYDPHLVWDPLVTSSCWHGVTTVVTGNCGLSLAPCKPKFREAMMGVFGKVEELSMNAMRAMIPWEWESYGQWLDRVDRGLGANVATLAGHNALRLQAMGEACLERAATGDEVEAMQSALREALDAGAFGWSTTISPTHVRPTGEPVPSRLANDEELVALAAVMGEYNRGYIEILTRDFLWGLSERDRALLLRLSRASGRPITWIGHGYKWNLPNTWREEQAWMAEASKQGALFYGGVRLQPVDRRISFKRTTFFNGLDAWRDIMNAPLPERIAKLRDPALRPVLRRAIDNPARSGAQVTGQALPEIRWPSLYVEKTALPKNKACDGRPVVELAKKRGVHIADFLCDLAAEEQLETQFRLKSILEQDEVIRGQLIQSPHVMLGNSDSGAHINTDCTAGEPTYFLKHWCLDRKAMSLEEGVRRWTWAPACMVGLTDRGLVREGMAADVIMFSPEELGVRPAEQVADVPGGETRYVQKASGIKHTIVNGRVTLEGDRHTGDRPGKVLRSGATHPSSDRGVRPERRGRNA